MTNDAKQVTAKPNDPGILGLKKSVDSEKAINRNVELTIVSFRDEKNIVGYFDP